MADGCVAICAELKSLEAVGASVDVEGAVGWTPDRMVCFAVAVKVSGHWEVQIAEAEVE